MPDDIAVGRQVEAVRLVKNLRQIDVAARAGVSPATIHRLEHGRLEGMTVGTLRAVSRAMELPAIVRLGLPGPEVDRLLDRTHAAMVERVGAELETFGWQVTPEYSFGHFGERGSVDVLAWHAAARTLLGVETKSRIYDLQDTLSTLDRKRRLLPRLVRDSFGWQPERIGVLLVMPETRSHRRLVERHAVTFRSAFPDRQIEVRHWLEQPSRDLRGLWFLNNLHEAKVMQRSRPKRSHRPAPEAHQAPDSRSAEG